MTEPGAVAGAWSGADEGHLPGLLEIVRQIPAHPGLDDLLTFLVERIKEHLRAEGASVMLWDRESDEIFFRVAEASSQETTRKLKEVRFPADKGIAGYVLRSGQPVLRADVRRDEQFYAQVDERSGFRTRSLAYVPLRVQERVIGVLGALNKRGGSFSQGDLDFLFMLSPTAAMAIENAQVSEELRRSYGEVRALNLAKTKMIEHLAHELKTPLAVIASSINLLERSDLSRDERRLKRVLDRTRRSLDRLIALEEEARDIAAERAGLTSEAGFLEFLLSGCQDLLEALVEEEGARGELGARLTRRLEGVFAPGDTPEEEIHLSHFLDELIKELAPDHTHRRVRIELSLKPSPPILAPRTVLRKTLAGMIRNAVEHTPDGGAVRLALRPRGRLVRIEIQDFGVGLDQEAEPELFHGFVHAGETRDYSTGRPYDFLAGGRGADLLRARLFAERFGFGLSHQGSRCRHISSVFDCPGRVEDCPHCRGESDCRESGGALFVLEFPAGQTRAAAGPAVGKRE